MTRDTIKWGGKHTLVNNPYRPRKNPTMTTNEKRLAVFGEVNYELDYQETRWGTDTDDTKNTPNDWVAYISHYATRWFTGGFAPWRKAGVDTFRTCMIKVAATAMSAVMSLDRQREKNGQAFYEAAEQTDV